ncbi:MAG TPA: M48 family metallopeptidase [Candidatus Methylomirabilis sp.]|nr:M48 family metallopeptidase [Candidatus Methylomirabilis sp.]
MQYEWRAYYLDGQTAIRHPAAVRIMREGLEVGTPGGWTRFWPYAELRQTQGFYAGEEVRLERGGDLSEALLIPGGGFLASLGEVAPQFRGRFHDPTRRRDRLRFVVLAAVAIVGIVGALYLWGIPALAALTAPRVPVTWEEQLGRSAVSYLAPSDLLCEDPTRHAALDAIVARLAATLPSSPYTFRVLVVNQPQVNALAAPGGYLVVYRGLLERTRSAEELAGVLAHEMQHVVQRHATQALIQHTSTGLLLAALTGDMTGPLAYGLQSARVLGQLQYSRRAESQADEEGMKMLLAARIDPSGMIGFFEALAKADRQPAMLLKYLSTHPSPMDRIEHLKALAATTAASGPPVALLPGVDWDDVKRLCQVQERPK